METIMQEEITAVVQGNRKILQLYYNNINFLLQET